MKLLRQQMGGIAMNAFFEGISRTASLHPKARPERHNIERLRNIPYRDTGRREHTLDVYRPLDPNPARPIVLYIHGGGFRILSKDTHWLMGLAFARQGYLVFNINYRLAPAHPFPAAIEDACHAYAWVVEHAREFGGDPDRIVVAGESAGANLATALTIAACYDRPEDFARRVRETDRVPRAVLPYCGIFQVSDVHRFRSRFPHMRTFVADRLAEVEHAYLEPATPHPEGGFELADVLPFFEARPHPERELPPFFAPVGTRDPLIDDTQRLARALNALDVPCEARYYPGELHAFHAFVWRKRARECWRDTFRFLSDVSP